MKAITLPIVVDKPASKLKKNANRNFSNAKITNLGKSKLINLLSILNVLKSKSSINSINN